MINIRMAISNPIDNLIDQIDLIDQNIQINHTNISDYCQHCTNSSTKIFKLSCNHSLCIQCAEKLIDNNNYKNCPSCKNLLNKDLNKIYSDFLADPVAKLSYYHNMNIGDRLWCYSGNDHNWLYTKEQCDYLNYQYQNYNNSHDDTDDDNTDDDNTDDDNTDVDSPDIITLVIKNQKYIIDFVLGIQYPLNMLNKKRRISFFDFNSLSDLKKNKIIGIAGKIF